MRKQIMTALVLLGLCTSSQAETIIHAGRFIDGRSDKICESISSVIKADRVVAVKEGFVKPAAYDKLIDLSQCTVMPGWMDNQLQLNKTTNILDIV